MPRFFRLAALASILLQLLPAGRAQAQFSVFGEFNLQAGRLNEANDERYTMVAGAGNFGLQFSVVALTIGAGPVYRNQDDCMCNRSFFDQISVQFPIGLQLRVPVHKEILVGGVEFGGVNYAYSAHLGVLFSGRWNDRGFFVNAGYDDHDSRIDYIGAGLKMTLPGL